MRTAAVGVTVAQISEHVRRALPAREGWEVRLEECPVAFDQAKQVFHIRVGQ
jgi:hypothetical protein